MAYLIRASVLALVAAVASPGALAQVQVEQLPASGSGATGGQIHLRQLPETAARHVYIQQLPAGTTQTRARQEAQRQAEAEAEERRAAEAGDERPVFDLPVAVARLSPEPIEGAADEGDATDSVVVSPLDVQALPSVGRGTGLSLSE